MKQEQQQQAERLYFQSDMNKTQIAKAIGVSRTTLHHWVRENNWEQLKKTGAAMPSLIAGNCYIMLAQLSEHILSENRKSKPVTREEVESMYKLTLTINKLKARVALNERMETFTGFIEDLHSTSPGLAAGVKPLISNYIASCATANTVDSKFQRSNTTSPAQDEIEATLDKEDFAAWAMCGKPIAGQHQSVPQPSPTVSYATDQHESETVEKSAAPKYDIRKQLRGTATTGPGKAFRRQQNSGNIAA